MELAMMHNEEKDRYRNNSIIAKYNHNFSEDFKIQINYRPTDTYMQYDKVVDTATATHDEELMQ